MQPRGCGFRYLHLNPKFLGTRTLHAGNFLQVRVLRFCGDGRLLQRALDVPQPSLLHIYIES